MERLTESLEDWIDSVSDRLRPFGISKEVGHVGHHAHVRLGPDLLQRRRHGLQRTAVKHLATFHKRAGTTGVLVDVVLDVRVTDDSEDLRRHFSFFRSLSANLTLSIVSELLLTMWLFLNATLFFSNHLPCADHLSSACSTYVVLLCCSLSASVIYLRCMAYGLRSCCIQSSYEWGSISIRGPFIEPMEEASR